VLTPPYALSLCIHRQVLHATNDYLGHSTKFRGVESVKSVRAAVESFNSEVDRDIEQGLAPAHPKLEPLEVASIVNLGLFDIDEVFEMFPSIRERFGGVPDALRPLLDTMASFQRDK
jgi:hypothetical protein